MIKKCDLRGCNQPAEITMVWLAKIDLHGTTEYQETKVCGFHSSQYWNALPQHSRETFRITEVHQ